MPFFFKRNPEANITGAGQAQGVGYIAGGNMGSFTYENTFEGIDFATGTTFMPSVFLTSWRYGSVGISNLTYGMVCGGVGSAGTTNYMDGILFASETAYNTSNSLSISISNGAGLNSSTAGYICGGYNGSSSNTISKVTFPANSATLAAVLASARYHCAGVSGTSTGFVAGGVTTGSTVTNEIDGLTFSTDTALNPAATLSVARSGITACDTDSKGYFMAGSTTITYSSAVNTLAGFDIINQLSYVLSSTLGTSVWCPAGVSGNTKGYQLGGQSAAGSLLAQTVGVNYYSEISFTNSYSITYGRNQSAGNLQSRQIHSLTGKTYFGGGSTANSAATATNNIDIIDCANDTSTEIAGNLSVGRLGLAGVNSKTIGLFAGGLTAGSATSNEIDGVYFATQTTLNPLAALSVARYSVAGWQSYARGYFGGGYLTSTYSTTIDGIIFGTLTSITTSATMIAGNSAAGSYQAAGFSYASSTFGWISGGITTTSVPSSVISAFHLSNETVYNATSAAAAKTSECIAGGDNANAYIIGGVNGSTYSTVIQSFNQMSSSPSITVSTATMTLPVGKAAMAAASGPSNSSYAAGGYNGSTVYNTIYKIALNTASLTTLAATLKTTNAVLAGVGSTNFYDNQNLAGYIAGGNFTGGNNYQSDIDAFDFASEGVSQLSATLSQGVFNAAAVSSVTKGYFGGGDISSTATTANIDGFTYATRAILSIASALATSRANADGVNSNVRGYFGGGRNSDGSIVRSQIDGINFYDESQINPSAALATARYALAGINSSTTGYWAGGTTVTGSSATTQIDGIIFSTEAATNPASNLPVARVNMGSITSPTVGYFGGGATYPTTNVQSAIYSFTYSTETCSSSSATLGTSRRCLRGFGNNVNGYFAGGTNNSFSTDYDVIERFVYSNESLLQIDATLTNAKNRVIALSAI
ncbi:MAG: hypothetical protein QXN55_00185 [Candidatus Nitrosotenuis sp.]